MNSVINIYILLSERKIAEGNFILSFLKILTD